MEDADVKELCGSTPLHPVRCPVIFLHFCAVVLLFFVKTVIACFRSVYRRVGRFAKKLEQCPLSFTNFLFNVRLGTGTSYARTMSSCGIQMFILIISPINAKQLMRKYHPQKSLSNSARSVVNNLPPSSYKILFSR